MDAFFKERIEKKRKIDGCGNALQRIREHSIADIVNSQWHEEDILAFLITKYGYRAVEIGRYALKNLPPKELLPKELKHSIGVLPFVINAGVSVNEAEQFVELLSRCKKFTGFCMDKLLETLSLKSGIPCCLLTPPEKLIVNGCLNCGSTLKTHNDRSFATVFTINGPIPAIKICWRCSDCGINYNYCQYGNKTSGFTFYEEKRPLIESSNVTYVDRLVCKYQIHLANHAWVSFEGFTETYNCVNSGASAVDRFEEGNVNVKESLLKKLYTELDRKAVSSAFYMHEVEEELRSRDLSGWIFKGEREESLDAVMKYVDGLRCSELYSHTKDDCSDACKKKGCDNFVSMDGIWKLRFPHCMYPVKTEVSGLPTINFPDVCPKEPLTRNSAFCKDHCELAEDNGIPTELRPFLHEYCGIPKNKDDSTKNEHVRSTDVDKVERKRNQLPTGKRSSELTIVQGTSSFLTKNQALLSVSMDLADTSSDPCNKDTGEKQKTLQKWSRGLLHYVRGGGHIDRWNPLFKSESPGQVFLLSIHYLHERLKDIPESQWEDFILSYDNMCNLCNLRAAREPLPLPKPHDKLWAKIKKVIDRLHLRNHKNPKCHEEYSSEPLKVQHPELNTMVAEQTFVWSARYKKILNAMPMRRFLFYYHRMVIHRNKYTAHCHKRDKIPLLPKVRASTGQ